MACLSASSSRNGEMLRKAQAASRVDGGKFYAVVVDSPWALSGKPGVRRLLDAAVLAKRLGAKIMWLESSDAAGALLQFARQAGVGRVFVTRKRPTLFSRWFGRSVYSDLLRRGKDLRIDVIGFERGK
jgi:K+-sensing histidine kinase KdpD